MSVTIYGSRTQIFPSIQLTLQCPSTCVRPIQPLASGALSINPPLTLSSLPSPPRNTQRRTSPLHFSFPRPAVHLSPPLLLSGSAVHLSPPFLLHWAGGAPPPSSSSPVWCRSLDNAGSWGLGSGCVNTGILGCAGLTWLLRWRRGGGRRQICSRGKVIDI
jgi:hypothetical protein